MDENLAQQDAATACEKCSARHYWLSNNCSTDGITSLAAIVKSKGPYRSGDYIFRAGQPSHALYVVRGGAVKCQRVAINGGLHVAGFFLPGEIFGCEDIGAGEHCYDAIALEDSAICEISLTRLEQLFGANPDLQHCFFSLISERIRSSEKIITDSFHLRAKQRIVNFLYDFYLRLRRHQRKDLASIALPMNKTDIASYLGISPETLSRLLKELEAEKLIRNSNRRIELIDPNNFAHHCQH